MNTTLSVPALTRPSTLFWTHWGSRVAVAVIVVVVAAVATVVNTSKIRHEITVVNTSKIKYYKYSDLLFLRVVVLHS